MFDPAACGGEVLVLAGFARWLLCTFFFFQAEDGIRDKLVTGVQTCALPIWKLRLGDVQFFVLDEADRLLDTGNEPTIMKIHQKQIGRASCRERV